MADLQSPKTSLLHPLSAGNFLVAVANLPDVDAGGPTFGVNVGAETEQVCRHQLALQVVEAHYGILVAKIIDSFYSFTTFRTHFRPSLSVTLTK